MTLPTSNRSGHSTFGRPAEVYSAADKVMTSAESAAPLGVSERQSVIRDVSTVSFIVILLVACRPSTIGRFVVAIIFNAINGMLWRWSSPHVIQKFLKAIAPTSTDRDSPSSIILIPLVVLVSASLDHMVPRYVLRRDNSASATSMNSVTRCVQLIPDAPTRACNAALEVCRSTGNLISAVTNTVPVSRVLTAWKYIIRRTANNYQAIEALIRDILKFRHFTTSLRSDLLRWAGAPSPVCRHYNMTGHPS